MTRKPPPPAPTTWADPKMTHEAVTLHLKLITPMFGGGPEPREIDANSPIRPASIRGHLRFWWRATAGARYGTVADMYDAEAALWGASAKRDPKSGNLLYGPGKVALEVALDTPAKSTPCAVYERRNDGKYRSLPDFRPYPDYALFPFKGEVEGGSLVEDPAECIPSARFTVRITFRDEITNEQKNEIEQAIAAWVYFGGVGARTRRGCGTLATDTVETIDTTLFDNVGGTYSAALKNACYVVGPITNDPIAAWRAAVEVYRDFRQKPGWARNPVRDGRPGRSRWPEPDSIRRLTGRSSLQHQPSHRVESGFPRADLGLPIVFQFKGRGDGDPDQCTFQAGGTGATRMASPVITKAQAVAGGKFRPLLLVLNTPHAWERGPLTLIGRNSQYAIAPANIELSAEERQLVSPLQGMSIRNSLLDYAARTWQSKVEVLG